MARKKANKGESETKAVRMPTALELRMRGLTYSQIGEQLNCSESSTHRYVKEALEILKKQTLESAEQYRSFYEAELNTAISKIWPRVEAGDPKAVEVYHKLINDKAKLWGVI